MNIREAFPRRSNGAPDIPIREIVNRLSGNTVALCEFLLPNGRRDGPEWRCGSVEGEPGKSLGVRLAGARAGVWSDFADGTKGDPLDLIQACLRLDKGAAVLWAKDWLGLGAPGWSVMTGCPRPDEIATQTVGDLALRRMVERIHGLGARTIYELLVEIGEQRLCRTYLEQRVRHYAEIDPKHLAALGGDRFPRPPLYKVSPS